MVTEHSLEDVRLYLKRTIGVERVVFFVKLAVIAFAFAVVVLGVGPLQARGPGDNHLEDVPEPGSSQAMFLRSVQLFKWQLLLYTVGNGIFWFCLFVIGQRISRYMLIKTIAFFLVIIDILFVSLLIWLLPSLQASLFWLYCFVLVHAVLLFPDALTLGVMTALSAAFYVGAVAWSVPGDAAEVPTDPEAQVAERQEEKTMILNVVILGLTGAGCWGANSLIQMRLRALSEEQERLIRTEKLNLAAMMASSIAHELKNPLGIMNNAAFILRRSQDQLDENLRDQVRIIAAEIQRSDKIIMDLLGYTKLAGGKIDRVNVNRVLDEALVDLKNEIASRQIVVAKAYARHLPRLLIDPTQLRTAVSNLLLNACEAIDSFGKITVTTGYSDEGFIEISIADTGKGISDDDLPKVFDSFFTTKDAGTGLGLSIVESITKAYGGTISVKSGDGSPTRFTMLLPIRTVRERR